MRIPVLFAVASLLLCQCAVDLALPEDAVIRCAALGDCPEGMTCSQQLERCVPIGQEEEPPVLLNFTVDAILGDGTQVTDATLFGPGVPW